MNKNTEEKLKEFSGLDTWSSNHPLDDQRFYDFIIEAHKNQDYTMPSENFLFVFGDLTEELEKIALKRYYFYINGIELLRRFNNNL